MLNHQQPLKQNGHSLQRTDRCLQRASSSAVAAAAATDDVVVQWRLVDDL